ncbi:translocation protein SEC62-like [Culicoides brevitarsis]|uniref:translocation protein SEC62-like n=1 Tax=Culicoides brevitarsis TaxID=469753 RepID=UPI00307C0F13
MTCECCNDEPQEYEVGKPKDEKPTRQELKVARWMKSNVPIKKTKFMNVNVEYFSSGKALDALMNSKFAQGSKPLFADREAAIDFLDGMLAHKLFHRAKKVPVSEQELRRKRKEGEIETEEQKKKRKIRLVMHPEQIFEDGHEAYIWIYDPIPVYYWFLGIFVVLISIVICLFPLWPPKMRLWVYYGSVTGAGFLVFILALALFRTILFGIIWILTLGRHHFWFLPNLTEDCGFFESFKPLYKYEYRGKDYKPPEKKSKKRKKDKESDAEEEKPLIKNEISTPEHEKRKISESESVSSSQSSTGKDFEFIDDHEAKEALN